MTLNKKHFELIAEMLREHISDGVKCFDSEVDCYLIADSFANRLEKYNKIFDRKKFLKACGVEYTGTCGKCGGYLNDNFEHSSCVCK